MKISTRREPYEILRASYKFDIVRDGMPCTLTAVILWDREELPSISVAQYMPIAWDDAKPVRLGGETADLQTILDLMENAGHLGEIGEEFPTALVALKTLTLEAYNAAL